MKVKIPARIPFNAKGNLLYRGENSWQQSVVWVDNKPFVARMKVHRLGQTYSKTPLVSWLTEDDRVYPMYEVEFNRIIDGLTLTDGWTEPVTWVVRLHGSTSYGLMRVD